jgi:hypothetical protein
MYEIPQLCVIMLKKRMPFIYGAYNWCLHIHYITFPGSKVSQNDCRMWNKSYKYKDIYSTTEAFQKYIMFIMYELFFIFMSIDNI